MDCVSHETDTSWFRFSDVDGEMGTISMAELRHGDYPPHMPSRHSVGIGPRRIHTPVLAKLRVARIGIWMSGETVFLSGYREDMERCHVDIDKSPRHIGRVVR